jgi:hypothetical protein
MKNVLIISPTPTHPTNAGNRRHIFSIVEDLKALNCNVFFYYVNREAFDLESMNSFFNMELEIFNQKPNRNFFYRVKRRIELVTLGIFDFSLQRKKRKQYNHPLDLDFPTEIIPKVLSIIKRKQIDVVIVEYVVLSKVLKYIPKNIKKIIDTHDKFTDRFEIYLNQGLNPTWTSLYKHDELKGLNRADSIICLNSAELNFYKKNGLKGSGCVYYNLGLKNDLSQNGSTLNLLYLASANEINKQSINDFLNNNFMSLVEKFPKLQLLVAGEISKHINLKHENIILLGFVDDLESYYSQGKIVINPEINGTGQKIKSIEALQYNKLLVSTTDIGIKDSKKLFFHCRDYYEMNNMIISIISNQISVDEKYLELEKFRKNQKQVLRSILY